MADLPPAPSNKGRKGAIKDTNGVNWIFLIEDEIMLPQSGLPNKLLCFQRIRFENGENFFRLGYYIIGKKPSRAGKWVWGQYATMLPSADLKELIRLAEGRQWFAVSSGRADPIISTPVVGP